MAAIPELSHHVNVILENKAIDRLISILPNNSIGDSLKPILEDLKMKYEDVANSIPGAVSEEFLTIAKGHINSMKSNRGNSTGMMAGSIETMPDGERSVLISETAESPDGFPYPLAFEKGRREIVPVEAKALRWWDGGTPIFAMRSAATPPRPFWKRSEEDIQPKVQVIVDKEISKKGV